MYRTKVESERQEPFAAQKAGIRKLALNRIRELETAIREEFDMHVRCAIEMEFFILNEKGAIPLKIIGDSGNRDHFFNPLQHSPTQDDPHHLFITNTSSTRQHPINFAQSGYIQKIHAENRPAEYEIVLDSKKKQAAKCDGASSGCDAKTYHTKNTSAL